MNHTHGESLSRNEFKRKIDHPQLSDTIIKENNNYLLELFQRSVKQQQEREDRSREDRLHKLLRRLQKKYESFTDEIIEETY